MPQPASWLDVLQNQYGMNYGGFQTKPKFQDLNNFIQTMYQKEAGTNDIWNQANPYASYDDYGRQALTQSPLSQRFNLMQTWLQGIANNAMTGRNPMASNFSIANQRAIPNVNAKQWLFQQSPDLKSQFMEYWRQKNLLDSQGAQGTQGANAQGVPQTNENETWSNYLSTQSNEQGTQNQAAPTTNNQTVPAGQNGTTASVQTPTASPTWSQVIAPQGNFNKNLDRTSQFYDTRENRKRVNRFENWKEANPKRYAAGYMPKWNLSPFATGR